MSKDSRIEKIIEEGLLAIHNGGETVDSLLEKHPKDASTLRPRLEAALWLANVSPSLDPRPGFVSSTRWYMEQRIALSAPRTAWQRLIRRYTPQRWIFNLISLVLLLTLLVFVTNNLVLTARLSIPGDPFYSTKLFIEDLRLAFTFNPEAKTDLYIQFSRERTAEFVDLVLEGDYAQLPGAADRMETNIISTLHSLNRISANTPKEEIVMIASLRNALSTEIVMLNVLRWTSPASAHAGIDLAIQVAQSGIMALR